MVLEKFASETERFGINWARALTPNTATITASSWVVEGSTATVSGETYVGSRTSALLAGGVAGETAVLVNTIETSDDQVLVKKLVVNIL